MHAYNRVMSMHECRLDGLPTKRDVVELASAIFVDLYGLV